MALMHSDTREMNVSDEDRARADVYRLLGVLLARPPDQDLLEMLRGIRAPAPETVIESGLGMSNAWRELVDAADDASPDALEREYHNLFIGLGKGELSPYMSTYLTGYLMEKPLADLREVLAGLGLARQETVREPEDHVAAVCEIMGVTIAENGLSFNEVKGLFDRFVRPWMPAFLADLEGAETARFYRAVGRLGSEFLKVEAAYFDMPA